MSNITNHLFDSTHVNYCRINRQRNINKNRTLKEILLCIYEYIM